MLAVDVHVAQDVWHNSQLLALLYCPIGQIQTSPTGADVNPGLHPEQTFEGQKAQLAKVQGRQVEAL